MGYSGFWSHKSLLGHEGPNFKKGGHYYTAKNQTPRWCAGGINAHMPTQYPATTGKAKLGHIISALVLHSLFSVVCLCNAGCEVTFTKIECIVKHRGRVVLRGKKCMRTGLWMVPVSTDTENAHMTINGTFHVMDTLQQASAAQEQKTHNIYLQQASPNWRVTYTRYYVRPPKRHSSRQSRTSN